MIEQAPKEKTRVFFQKCANEAFIWLEMPIPRPRKHAKQSHID